MSTLLNRFARRACLMMLAAGGILAVAMPSASAADYGWSGYYGKSHAGTYYSGSSHASKGSYYRPGNHYPASYGYGHCGKPSSPRSYSRPADYSKPYYAPRYPSGRGY